MIRYFYYLVFLNMVVNVVAFVPGILLEERFSGAVMAILIAPLISMPLIFIFLKGMKKFPQKGLPEILKEHLAPWAKITVLLYFSSAFVMAGFITLAAYSDITIRFINPDMEQWMVNILLIGSVTLLALIKTDRILYTLEIMLFLNLPLIFLIMFNGIRSPYVDWDGVMQVATYVWNLPSWAVLSAATYSFAGYLNLVIFNRVFGEEVKMKWIWTIGILGLINLCVSFFLPIGFHGTQGVADYLFPWIVTADSIRMEFGPVERMVFVFLLLYISISVISAMVHWHVGSRLLRSLFPPAKMTEDGDAQKDWTLRLILIGFAIAAVSVDRWMSEGQLFLFAEWWLNIRLASEIALVLLIFFLSRRVKA